MERETGLEPATFSLGSHAGPLADLCTNWQNLSNHGLVGGNSREPSHPLAQTATDSRASVGQPGDASAAVDSTGSLLTVRQVAARLNVCTASVYKLCAEGRLAHVRVLDAIRVAPGALDAFVATQSR